MAVAINEYVAENGRKSFYLHEILIKNKDASPFMAEQQKTVSAGKASFDTTVPKKEQPVSSQYMQEGENYTEPNADGSGVQYSISEKSRNSNKSLEIYTEEQYNDFGWVSYNDVITATERQILLSRYADYKHNKDRYPTTRFGEAVIHSTECPDVIMYVKGDIGMD